MSFDWSSYLEVAKHLSAQMDSERNREAFQRAAIGRAYYAAFGVACTHIRKRGKGGIPSAGKHVFVKKWFSSKGGFQSVLISEKLGYLLIQRAMADYEDYHSPSAQTVEHCLDCAGETIQLIRKIK